MKNLLAIISISALVCGSVKADTYAHQAADLAALEAIAEVVASVNKEQLSAELQADIAELAAWAANADDVQLRNKLNKVFNTLRVLGLLECGSLAVEGDAAIGGSLTVEGGIFGPGGTTGFISEIDGDTGFISGSVVSLTANTTAGSTVNFVGNDTTAMTLNVSDANGNTIIGLGTGDAGTGAANNTLIGFAAGGAGNLTGGSNTGVGRSALVAITTGVNNVAVGERAGILLTSGSNNILLGVLAGGAILDGASNICIGNTAGSAVTAGFENVYIGGASGGHATGNSNTFVGTASGTGVLTGGGNVAVGAEAFQNASGAAAQNVAVGQGALGGPLTSSFNVAVGLGSGAALTSGTGIFIGHNAGVAVTTGAQNTIIGNTAGALLVTGTGNVIIGYNGFSSGDAVGAPSASSNIIIGTNTVAPNNFGTPITNSILVGSNTNLLDFDLSNSILIGNGLQTTCSISGIFPSTTGTAANVVIGGGGQLQRSTSMRMHKDNIATIDQDTDKLHALAPSKFIMKNDASKKQFYGFIAEDVAESVPELAQYDDKGNAIFIEYYSIVALLVAEAQKMHARITQLEEQAAS